jgi:hypothetical protein
MSRIHKNQVLNKLKFLLSNSQKKQLAILAVLLFLGMLFEMLGLGLLIPALSILLDADIVKHHAELNPLFNFFLSDFFYLHSSRHGEWEVRKGKGGREGWVYEQSMRDVTGGET